VEKHNCKQQASKYIKCGRLGHLARYCIGNTAKGEEVKKGSYERSDQERREKGKVRKSPSNKTNQKKRVL
jgi:hypothetical protein